MAELKPIPEAAFEAAVRARATELAFYSPYNFLREVPADLQFAAFVQPRLTQHQRQEGPHRVFQTTVAGQAMFFLYTTLAWDSAFFQRPVIRLYTVLSERADVGAWATAAADFRREVIDAQPATHCFVEIPSEDVLLAQALGRAGFGLVETRAFFYHDAPATFAAPRYPVRLAHGDADAARVGTISAEARNVFDRFHADAWLAPADGDRLLRAYAEAAVRGYSDAVLVPDETVAGVPLDSFLAISDLKTDAVALGVGLARVVLTAVGATNRGWHQKLVSETLHYARERGVKYALMTTQTTNRAVFRTAEKLGWKLGGTGHVLSCGS
jgi:dTDP-4-amino-4,6-dideoxy-D-galactose acyltransferase